MHSNYLGEFILCISQHLFKAFSQAEHFPANRFSFYLPCSVIICHVQLLSAMFSYYLLPCSVIICLAQLLSAMFSYSLSFFSYFLPCSVIICHFQILSAHQSIFVHGKSLSIMFRQNVAVISLSPEHI